MKSVLFLLIIIVLVFLLKTSEDFKNCPNCFAPNIINVSHLSASQCGKCPECGWCSNKYNVGSCVRGNKNGPLIQNCDSWWHLNKCIYGSQCDYNSLYYYSKHQNPYPLKAAIL